MAIERIAEFLASVGFEEDKNKSLRKLLTTAEKQLKKLQNVRIKINSGDAEGFSRTIKAGMDQAVESARKIRKEVNGARPSAPSSAKLRVPKLADNPAYDIKAARDFKRTVAEANENINQANSKILDKLQSGKATPSEAKFLSQDVRKQFQTTVAGLRGLSSRLRKTVNAIGDDISKTESKLAQVKGSAKKAIREVTQARMSGDAKRIKSASKAAASILSTEKALKGRLKTLERQLTSVVAQEAKSRVLLTDAAVAKAEARHKTFFTRMREGVARTRNAYNSFLVPLAGALAITKTADVSKNFQGLQVALETALGSAQSARNEMGFLRQESSRLGLSLLDTGPSFAKLTAGLKQMGMEGQDARDIFLGVAEASTAMQLSAEDTEGVIRAFVQMAGKGTVQSEELKNQVGERIPGAMAIAAKSMGKTTAEFSKMLEQGQVLSKDFLPVFSKQLREFAAPGLEKSTKSFTAELNRAKTSGQNFLASMGEAGLLDVFIGVLRGTRVAMMALQPVVNTLAASLKFATTPFRALSSMFTKMEDDTTQAKSGLEAVHGAVKAVGIALGAILARFLIPFALKIPIIGAALAGLGARLATFSGALGVARLGLGALMFVAKRLIAPILAIAAALDVVEVASETGRKTIFHTLEEKMPLVGGMIGKVVITLGKVYNIVTSVLGGMLALVTGTTSFSEVLDEVKSKFMALLDPSNDLNSGLGESSKFLDTIDKHLGSIELVMLQIKKVWSSIWGDTEAVNAINKRMEAVKGMVLGSANNLAESNDQDISRRFGGTFFGEESLNKEGQAKLSEVLKGVFSTGKATDSMRFMLREELGVSGFELKSLMDSAARLQADPSSSPYAFTGMLKSQGLDKEMASALLNMVKSGGSTDNSKKEVTVNQTFNLPKDDPGIRHTVNVGTASALSQVGGL